MIYFQLHTLRRGIDPQPQEKITHTQIYIDESVYVGHIDSSEGRGSQNATVSSGPAQSNSVTHKLLLSELSELVGLFPTSSVKIAGLSKAWERRAAEKVYVLKVYVPSLHAIYLL